MRILAALGDKALLGLEDREAAVATLAALARRHELVITHGADAEGTVGYQLAREVGAARSDREVVAVLTQTVVDPGDDACLQPRDVVEGPIIRLLVDCGVVVIAAAGGVGGTPVTRTPDGALHRVDAVVNKDLAAAALAIALDADLLLMLTDVAAVYEDFGTLDARPIGCATPMSLYTQAYPAGTMGAKVDAACRFVARTGRRAAIGRLADAPGLVAGRGGTFVVPNAFAGIGQYTKVHQDFSMITVPSPKPAARTRQPSDA